MLSDSNFLYPVNVQQLAIFFNYYFERKYKLPLKSSQNKTENILGVVSPTLSWFGQNRRRRFSNSFYVPLVSGDDTQTVSFTQEAKQLVN